MSRQAPPTARGLNTGVLRITEHNATRPIAGVSTCSPPSHEGNLSRGHCVQKAESMWTISCPKLAPTHHRKLGWLDLHASSLSSAVKSHHPHPSDMDCCLAGIPATAGPCVMGVAPVASLFVCVHFASLTNAKYQSWSPRSLTSISILQTAEFGSNTALTVMVDLVTGQTVVYCSAFWCERLPKLQIQVSGHKLSTSSPCSSIAPCAWYATTPYKCVCCTSIDSQTQTS